MKIYMVMRDNGTMFLPYSGAYETGSREVAELNANANKHLGWEVVACIVIPATACNRCGDPAAVVHKCPTCIGIPLCDPCVQRHILERVAEDNIKAKPADPVCRLGRILQFHTQPCEPGCNYPSPRSTGGRILD